MGEWNFRPKGVERSSKRGGATGYARGDSTINDSKKNIFSVDNFRKSNKLSNGYLIRCFRDRYRGVEQPGSSLGSMDTKLKADIAESAVITELLKRGFRVLKPIGDRLPYDLAIDFDGRAYTHTSQERMV